MIAQLTALGKAAASEQHAAHQEATVGNVWCWRKVSLWTGQGCRVWHCKSAGRHAAPDTYGTASEVADTCTTANANAFGAAATAAMTAARASAAAGGTAAERLHHSWPAHELLQLIITLLPGLPEADAMDTRLPKQTRPVSCSQPASAPCAAVPGPVLHLGMPAAIAGSLHGATALCPMYNSVVERVALWSMRDTTTPHAGDRG